MAARRTAFPLSQLWQFPLFIVSVALFGLAAYLLVNARPRATLDQKIDVAIKYIKLERPEAAIEQLNRILATETSMDAAKEGVIHILIGQAIADGQQQRHLNIPENYRRIIEQTELGMTQGAPADSATHARLAESYAALGQSPIAEQQLRTAIDMDSDHSLPLRRKLIEMQIADGFPQGALTSVEDYLKQGDLTSAEKSWALAQKAELLIDQGEYEPANGLLTEAIRLSADPVEQGQFNYELGYCAWRQKQPADAERYLRLARDEMKANHPMDGDACYLLGRIYQDRQDPQTADSFYQVILTSYPESRYAGLARLNRGICRLMQNEREAGLNDLHDLTLELSQKVSRPTIKSDAIDCLRQAADLLKRNNDYAGALEVMAYEQELTPSPDPSFYARLANLYMLRADQLEQSIPTASDADQVRFSQQVSDFRTQAGDAYIALSRGLIMTDDKGYGQALWNAVAIYDKAGNIGRVISALELFTIERPSDKLAPDALLRLGQAYQAAGMFDKAIRAFQENQLRYPKSLAASQSAVPLAEAYLAKGPDYYLRAEHVLLSIVEDNDLIDPSAAEFHQSLFELARLYYRMQRYEEAVARLDELAERYPNDDRLPQITFLMADSYRKSASLLDVKLASTDTAATQATAGEALEAKKERLKKAYDLFDKVVAAYQANPPTTDADKLYQKLSYFYRGDCLYDLGRYAEAIKLYDKAAYRYQDDPAALAAYVQIVNSYCALKQPEQARAANERAKWILRRMPPGAFQNDSFTMPKKYWDDWLTWSSTSGTF